MLTYNPEKATSLKRLKKRDFILKESRRLFGLRGFDKTSIKDIAAACNCTQGNIYFYFSSKEDILFEVLQSEIMRLIELIQPLEYDETMNPVEKFEVFVQRHVIHSLDLIYCEAELKRLAPFQRARIVELRDVYDRILRKILQQGISMGLFKKINIKVLNYSLASTVVRAKLWYSPKGNLTPEEFAKEIIQLFFHGFLA